MSLQGRDTFARFLGTIAAPLPWALGEDQHHLLRVGDAIARGGSGTETSSLPETSADLFHRALGVEPYPWQRDYLALTDSQPCSRQRNAIGTCRQAGKSTVVSVRAAWRLLRWPAQQCIVLAKTDMQAKLVARRIKRIIAEVVPPTEWPVDNAHETELPNGNQLYTLPGGNEDGVRGFSPTLLLLDEAAFVSELLIAAISPLVSRTAGDWDMISSANAPAGTFFEAMMGEQSRDWRQTIITADACPWLTPEFLDAERRRLGDARFRREYYVEFTSPEGSFFSADALKALLDEPDTPPLEKGRSHPKRLGDLPELEDMEAALDLTRWVDPEYDRYLDEG